MNTPTQRAHNLQIIADQKAEIERLKEEAQWAKKCWTDEVAAKVAEIERLRLVVNVLEAAAKRDAALITELADALRIRIPGSYNEQDLDDLELCERAREASKDEP